MKSKGLLGTLSSDFISKKDLDQIVIAWAAFAWLMQAHGASVTMITETQVTDRPRIGLEMSPTKVGVIYY